MVSCSTVIELSHPIFTLLFVLQFFLFVVGHKRKEQLARKPKTRPNTKKSKAEKKAPITPDSVLRTNKSQEEKYQTNRVNWSTPNGTAGIPAANRGYEAVPVSEFREQYAPGEEPRSPSGKVLRRSSRARFKPLQFWKNEKLIFEPHNETGTLGEAMGDMPVVAAVQLALPTPHKERLGHANDKKKEKDSKKKRARKPDGDEGDSHDGELSAKIPFDPTKLTKKYRFINGEHGSVWSETLEDVTDLKIVSRLKKHSFAELPLSSTRGKKESKVVGFASQAFHVHTDPKDLFPGFMSGFMVLPPRGIKDAEGVGLCSQVINVGDCQPNSVEFALADPSSQAGEFDPDTAQRFLLSKGDTFQIPPGNIYRIENHSRMDEARLFWTIIKCTSKAEQESDEE
jgi:centromere protein C